MDILSTDEGWLWFHWLISLVARLMYRKPLKKCAMPPSALGKSSMGILEKCAEGLYGKYYSVAPKAVFCKKLMVEGLSEIRRA